MSHKLSAADLMKAIADSIEEVLPDDLLFALLVFPNSDPGTTNYVSNAHLSDMIIALRDGADRLEAIQGHMDSGTPTRH